MQARPQLVGFKSPVNRLRDLFRAQSDQHANNDDADLAGELTPAVQRFGQMKVNAVLPRGELHHSSRLS
jgi:hypothetical protein